MLDFLNAVPKLFLRLRLFTKSTAHSSGKETASGYAHTFSDCRGIDLSALSTFPTDDEINQVAKIAYDEAENLIFILGVSPESLADAQVKDSTPAHTVHSDGSEEGDEFDGDEEVDEGTAINYLYDCIENLGKSTLSSSYKDQLRDLGYASVMLSAHQDTEM